MDWFQRTAETIHWHETGEKPWRLPTGWTPGEEDLRVVWLNKNEPHRTRVAVWPGSAYPEVLGWVTAESSDDFISFRVTDRTDGVKLWFKLGVLDSHGTTWTMSVDSRELPARLDASDGAKHLQPVTKPGFRFQKSQDNTKPARFCCGFLVRENGGPVRHWKGRWQIWVERADVAESIAEGTPAYKSYQREYLDGPLTEPKPLIVPPRAVSSETND